MKETWDHSDIVLDIFMPNQLVAMTEDSAQEI